MTIVLWILVGLCGAAVVVGGSWLVHRFCVRLEEAGYLIYRKKSGGGGGGVFHELDRLVRPSIVHVVETEDKCQIEKESIGGD